jgi:flagellar hook-length control protein FliK
VQQPNNRFAAAVTSAAQTLAYGKNAAVEQVVVQLQNRANKASQITVQLTPAELGRVDVRLDVKRDGQTHAVIIADKPETLALLQKDATQLEKALQHAGLNANAENMSFNLREQRQANQGFSRNKRLGRDATDTAPIKELALNVHGDGTVISDNRVNYHA